MAKKSVNKKAYTKIFLRQSDIATSPANVKEHLHLWWVNTREKDEGGLRLTEEGFEHLEKNLGVKFFSITLPVEFKITTQTIIYIDQFVDCPYYLDNRRIAVTDEKKATELVLFSGDLTKYGLTKAMKRKEQLDSIDMWAQTRTPKKD